MSTAPSIFTLAKRVARLKTKKKVLMEHLDAIYVDQRKYNLVQTLEEAKKIVKSL